MIIKISTLKTLVQYKNILFWTLIFTSTCTVSVFLYPKTELTIATSKSNMKMLDENGKIKKEYNKHTLYTLQQELQERGVTLRFKSQNSDENAKPLLEYLVNNPAEIDFVISTNYGGILPETESKKASSLGAISVRPFILLTKRNSPPIKLLRDLKGKKIAFWTSPEGKKNPVFTVGGEKASEYSSDIFMEKLFNLAGVTAENSKLINFWNNKISASDDWDVYITGNIPSKNGSNSTNKDIYEALLSHDIKFLEFEDIDAINKNLPQTKLLEIPKSMFNPENNFPSQSFKTLGVTSSVFVRNDLDSSLVLILSQSLKEIYGKASRFARKDEYPNFSAIEIFEPSKIAEKFYREGDGSIFRNYFSPIFAAFITKLFFILAPIFFILIPILSILPGALKKYFQIRINKYYEEIYAIEKMMALNDLTNNQLLKKRLEMLDNRVSNVKFPILHDEFVQQIFIVREHIVLIQKKMARMQVE